MATTTKKTSQSKTRAKSTAPKGRKTKTTQTAAPQGKYKIFLGIAAFLVLCTTIFAIYALSTVKVENNESKVVKTKQTVTTSKSKPAKIQNNYKYKQILENDEIDSGSGVKVTRDYEAEKNAKEAAYRKKLAEQRKKLREQKEALILKKEKEALLRQQKRLQKLNKSNQNASNQKVLTTEQLKDNKMYILCEKYNFRTVKDAEKQKDCVNICSVRRLQFPTGHCWLV
jgi:hypothetical protein